MGELVHTSHVKIYQDKGPLRRAFIENFPEPVRYGVHGGIKHFYKMEPEEDIPSTLDHMISAVSGWLTGTLAGALAARGIPVYPDKLWSEVEGDIENEGGVIVIKRIRVKYHIKIPKGKRPKVERVVTTHERKCPAATSVRDCINIQYSSDIVEE